MPSWAARRRISPEALSLHQQNIAVLIAEGLSDAEIARTVAGTRETLGALIEDILRRLGVESRTQVAVWAVEHGLYRLGEDDDEMAQQTERTSWRGRTVGDRSASRQPGNETSD